jgi:MSHA biogenesis protein MshQ
MSRDYDTACASALIHPQRLPVTGRPGLCPACGRKPLVLALWAALAALPPVPATFALATGAATLMYGAPGTAATYFTRNVSGNWNANTTWSTAACGGVAAAGTPGAADNVIICSNTTARTYTVTANHTVASVSFNATGTQSTTVTVNAGILLNVTGAITINPPTTNARTHTLRLNANGRLIAGSLSLGAGAGTRRTLLTLTSNAGTAATILGNLTMNATSTNACVAMPGLGTLAIGGNFSSGGCMTISTAVSTGTVLFNGTGNQTIGTGVGATARVYPNLIVSKGSGTATLGGNISISGNLTNNTTGTAALNLTAGGTRLVSMTSGFPRAILGSPVAGVTTFDRLTVTNSNTSANLSNRTVTLNHNAAINNVLTLATNGSITTGANTLTLLSTATGAVTGVIGSTNYRCIRGNLRWAFAAGASSRTFPVCTVNSSNTSDGDYSTVLFAVPAGTTAGNLTVSTTQGDHPSLASSGIITSLSVNRYWTLTLNNGTIGGSGANLTFSREADDQDAGVNTGNFFVRRHNGSAWSATTTGTRAALTTQFLNQATTNLTGDYAVGEIPVDHFSFNTSGGGTAVACAPFTLNLTAHAADHSQIAPAANTTVALSANVGAGDWSLVSGGGSLSNPVANDGQANYSFNGSNTFVTLNFSHPTSGNGTVVNFNASSGNITETSGNATGADDLSITWYQSLFQWRNVTDGNSTLTVQLAGKPSDTGYGSKTLALRAVSTDPNTSACVNLFNGSRAVELAAECNNPVNCTAGMNLSINGANIAIAEDNGGANASGNYTAINLTFNASSWAPFNLSYPNAGNVSLHARYDLDNTTAGYEMSGSSNVFTVRPFALRLGTAFETDNASNTNPGAANATGLKFLRAGNGSTGDASRFSLNLSAVQWEAADDANNDGQADAGANLSGNTVTPNFGNETSAERFGLRAVTLVSPAGGSTGVLYLNGNTTLNFTASGGSANLTQLGYDQAGVFNVTAAVADDDYLGLGAAETGLMNVTSGNIGRFYPARLNVTLANTPQAADRCTAGGGLTYIGQPFYYSTAPLFTITALSTANTTLNNYGGGTSGADGYWKLNTSLPGRSYTDLANVSNATFNATLGAGAVLSNHSDFDGSGTLALNATGFAAASCADNAGNGSDCFLHAKGNLAAPFSSHFRLTLNATADLTDSDGACYNSSGGTGCEDYNLTVNTAQGAHLRWGRLTLLTTQGSETQNLTLPLRAEYWDGTGWLTSSADSCTALNLSGHVLLRNPATGGGANQSGNTSMSIGSGSTNATLSPATAASGLFGFAFSAPGAGNAGFVDVTLNATALTPDFDHLRYDWDGDGAHDDWPGARATFGVYSQYRNVIYRREPGW